MRTRRQLLRNLLPIGILACAWITAPAQDPELLRHFDYDQKAPLEIKQIGVQRRAHAKVYDISYASPKAAPSPPIWSCRTAAAHSPPSSGVTGTGKTLRCAIAGSFSMKPWRWPKPE